MLVSAVSFYEIEYKRRRDPEIARLPADVAPALLASGFTQLALTCAHAELAGRLPRLHGDPFDRMLAAQALIENATLISRDAAIAAYGAVTVW